MAEDRIRVVVEGDAKPLQAAAAAAKRSVRDIGDESARESRRARSDWERLRAALAKPFRAKVEAETDRPQREVGRFRRTWEALRAQTRRAIRARVEVDTSRARSAVAGLDRDLKGASRSAAATAGGFDRLDTSVGRANSRFTLLRDIIRLLKWPALIAGVGTAIQGFAALAAGAGALASALAPLSGMLVAYRASWPRSPRGCRSGSSPPGG